MHYFYLECVGLDSYTLISSFDNHLSPITDNLVHFSQFFKILSIWAQKLGSGARFRIKNVLFLDVYHCNILYERIVTWKQIITFISDCNELLLILARIMGAQILGAGIGVIRGREKLPPSIFILSISQCYHFCKKIALGTHIEREPIS